MIPTSTKKAVTRLRGPRDVLSTPVDAKTIAKQFGRERADDGKEYETVGCPFEKT